jgi:hypothetical protein
MDSGEYCDECNPELTPEICKECENALANCECCETCESYPCECDEIPDYCYTTGGRFGFGRVMGGENVTVADALQILRTLVGLSSVINGQQPHPVAGATQADALMAATIVTPGAEAVVVGDALQILRHLVGLSTVRPLGG